MTELGKKAGYTVFLMLFRGLRAQRWRALKRGLLLQITKTLPRRRTILQSRWRCLADLSEESTFMAAFVDYGMEAAADCNVLGRKRKTLDLAILRASLEYVPGLVYYRLCILCQIKKRLNMQASVG